MAALLESLLTAAATAPAAGVTGLHRRVGDRQVLRGVELALARGEFVALLGAPGAGKSTLLRCLAGIEPFDQGAITLRGRAPARHDVWRRSVGWVFQGLPESPPLSLGEHLMRTPALAERADAAVQARELLSRVGLAERFGAAIGELTAAQRQRAAMARALATEPSVLLCDDLTDPSDPEQAGEVAAAARALASDGLTLLLATHDLALARQADRVVILHEGRIQASGVPGELLLAPPAPPWRRWLGRGAVPPLALPASRYRALPG